jgi:hypothetical protein
MEIDLPGLGAAGRAIATIGETTGTELDKAYPDSAAATSAHAGLASAGAMDTCEQRWRTRCHDEAEAVLSAGRNVMSAADNYVTADGNAAARFMYGPGR